MNPVIKNFRNLHVPGRPSTRLIGLDDNPPTCTMTYSEINPGQTSTHHIHSWEHEVYIISGSGTLMCDGKGYPVKAGDGIFIPGNVDHYTLNDGGARVIRRLEINPLVATQSGGARNNGGVGTGEPPVIRNRSELMGSGGVRLISSADGAPTYSMLYIELAGGQSSHQDAGGHTHPWGACGLRTGRSRHAAVRRPGVRSLGGGRSPSAGQYPSPVEEPGASHREAADLQPVGCGGG